MGKVVRGTFARNSGMIILWIWVTATVGVAGDPNISARDIILKASQQESLLSSGRILFHIHEQDIPLDEKVLRQFIKDPKQLKIELEINKQIRNNPIRSNEILFIFDNNSQRFLQYLKKDKNSLYNSKLLLTPQIMISHSYDPNNPTKDYWVFKFPPRKYLGGWEMELLRGRFWELKKDDSKAVAKLIDNSIVIFSPGGKNDDCDEMIWIDSQNDYLIKKLQVFQKNTNKLELQSEIFYKKYNINNTSIWYPNKIFTSRYVNFQGHLILQRKELYIIKRADLNISLKNEDFDIGDIPVGAIVQDNRFDPPLVYRQGYRQFTDKELFQMAKNRELLKDSKWMGYEVPVGQSSLLGYIIAGIGLILTVISIYMARRTRHK